MKALFFTTALTVLLLGCRSTDPFDRLVVKLTDRGGPSTHCWVADAPATASPAEVAAATLEPSRSEVHVKKVLKVRKVRILDETYTAVLVDTKGAGRKIVLILLYRPNISHWNTQVYDAE
jgi:hypothetical protein